MGKNLFHVFYVAISVFMSLFLVEIYASPARASSVAPIQVQRIVTREIVRVECKYIYLYTGKPPESIVIDKN